MKVCHMTSTHNVKDQRIFYKECVSLAKAGYEVYLVEQGNSEEAEGVHIVGTQEQNKGRYYRLLVRPYKVYQIAKKLDADVYHFHDMELLPFGVKLKKKGKKVVFDYHEDYATRFADSDALTGPKWVKDLIAKLYCWYEYRSARQLDAMISVTPHICERLAKANPNTVMVTNYPLLDTETWKKETEYDKISKYVAFAGQVSETYRLAFITRALQSAKDIEFRICGPQRKSDDLEKIQAEDTGHIVNYLGVLPYMEIPPFLSNARASFVISTYGNNTGGNIGTLGNNKLFEAMLCGVPVICADYILWKEIIEKYRCGICVNPYDEKQIADAVQYILDHPDEAVQMGQNGRKAVLEVYNWNTQEQVLLDLYEKLK